MIELKMMNGNNIINIIAPGKQVIKSSQGLLFYSPMELLCSSLGSCIGKHLVIYCSHNSIDITSFEFIGIDMIDGDIKVIIKHPVELSEENISDIKKIVETCEIRKMLDCGVYVQIEPNAKETARVVDDNKPKPCCGDKV